MSKFTSGVYDVEGLRGKHWCDHVATRSPRKGEYYLSGAIVSVYLAYADMAEKRTIVKPTHKAVPQAGYVRGATV